MGFDGHRIALEAPPADNVGLVPLTNKMLAAIQGFPPKWEFSGNKVAVFKQVANAVPPFLAAHVACAVRLALTAEEGEIDRIIEPIFERHARMSSEHWASMEAQGLDPSYDDDEEAQGFRSESYYDKMRAEALNPDSYYIGDEMPDDEVAAE